MTMIFRHDAEGATVLVGDTDTPLTDFEQQQADLRAIRASAAARVELTTRRLGSRVGAFGQLEGRHRKIVKPLVQRLVFSVFRRVTQRVKASMTTPELPNRTESRASALAEVRAGKIFYGDKSGIYFENTADGLRPLSGARRRTFAELRQAGVVEPTEAAGVEAGRKLLTLTKEGLTLVLDWEV